MLGLISSNEHCRAKQGQGRVKQQGGARRGGPGLRGAGREGASLGKQHLHSLHVAGFVAQIHLLHCFRLLQGSLAMYAVPNFCIDVSFPEFGPLLPHRHLAMLEKPRASSCSTSSCSGSRHARGKKTLKNTTHGMICTYEPGPPPLKQKNTCAQGADYVGEPSTRSLEP